MVGRGGGWGADWCAKSECLRVLLSCWSRCENCGVSAWWLSTVGRYGESAIRIVVLPVPMTEKRGGRITGTTPDAAGAPAPRMSPVSSLWGMVDESCPRPRTTFRPDECRDIGTLPDP